MSCIIEAINMDQDDKEAELSKINVLSFIWKTS